LDRKFGGPKPFLKWAGSKWKLLSSILPYFPDEIGTYYEPFLGSGAAFFAIQPAKARLGDAAADLVATYEAVRDNVGAVIGYLKPLSPDKETYYRIRANRSEGRYKRAAEFIYLNKTCWNGLYRVNAKGEFNVPFGQMKSKFVVDESHLRQCSSILQGRNIGIENGDFEEIVRGAKRGDLVYFDPPYVTSHYENGFLDWNEKIFSWQDQVRLAALAKKLAKNGVRVIVTNADHPETIGLYSDFKIVRITRNSTLASNPKKRRKTTEVLLVS
jgi:DNA adenine methylase